MENNKIRIYDFVKKEYYDIEFDIFVNSYVKTGFFTRKSKTIEATIIKPCKIEEKDKQRVIDYFLDRYNQLESLVKNASKQFKTTKEYKDNLYSLLLCLEFYLLSDNSKIVVLKMLNVNQMDFKSILFDFNLDNYKK